MVPVASLPATGSLLSVLRVSVEGLSLAGDPVQLERTGLALQVLSPSAHDALADDDLVTRRLVELSAAEALTLMRAAAGRGNWDVVDRMLHDASVQLDASLKTSPRRRSTTSMSRRTRIVMMRSSACEI